MPFFVSKAHLAELKRSRDEWFEAAKTQAAAAVNAQLLIHDLQATNRVLERQNAVHQANTGWLRNHVNQLTDERARLLLRDLNFLTDAPEILSMPTAATTAPRKTAVDEAQERDDVAVADAISGAGLFEDMGDEAAKVLGVDHAPDGGLIYRK